MSFVQFYLLNKNHSKTLSWFHVSNHHFHHFLFCFVNFFSSSFHHKNQQRIRKRFRKQRILSEEGKQKILTQDFYKSFFILYILSLSEFSFFIFFLWFQDLFEQEKQSLKLYQNSMSMRLRSRKSVNKLIPESKQLNSFHISMNSFGTFKSIMYSNWMLICFQEKK